MNKNNMDFEDLRAIWRGIEDHDLRHKVTASYLVNRSKNEGAIGASLHAALVEHGLLEDKPVMDDAEYIYIMAAQELCAKAKP